MMECSFSNFPIHVTGVTKSRAHVAQLAEHVLGKDEVTRSIRVVGSTTILESSFLARMLVVHGVTLVCLRKPCDV